MTTHELPAREDNRVRLADGRWLGFAEYGDLHGYPIVILHGLPGSRLQRPADLRPALDLQVRLIIPDRPGVGLSDPQPARRLLDWPRDLSQLADNLGIERFGLVGVSAGAPYALACAHCIPARLDGVAVVSPLGPTAEVSDRRGLSRMLRAMLALARHAPTLLHGALLWARIASHDDPQRYVKMVGAGLAQSDRAVLARPGVRAVMRENIRAALAQGMRPLVQELALLARPWGFAPDDLSLPVQLWHGQDDRIIPVAMAERLAHALPQCDTHWLDSCGHLFLFERWPDVVAELLD